MNKPRGKFSGETNILSPAWQLPMHNPDIDKRSNTRQLLSTAVFVHTETAVKAGVGFRNSTIKVHVSNTTILTVIMVLIQHPD